MGGFAPCGRGIGKALYTALIKILILQNIQNVYAGIASPNPRSERLHQSLEFTKSGIYHETGFKRNQWHDVMWFEKQIGRHELDPAPFIEVGEIQSVALDDIFRQCELMMDTSL